MTTAPAPPTESAPPLRDAAVHPPQLPPQLLQRAAVLGAGIMGSRIAAHLANAGLPVLLLDLAAKQGDPASIAKEAIERLVRGRPAAFYDPANARLVRPGSFDRDLPLLSDCDWVIEAVSESLPIKRALLGKVAPHLKPGAVFTTNTSGLSVAEIAEALPPELRRSWFGTHFFNPPRYMRLLEIIPAPESDPAAVARIADFAGRRLGKSVVYARDTPNFIANRIGVDVMLQAFALMQRQGLSIEEVDALTGSAIGWPRTGTFRLADMVGIDTLAHVVANFSVSQAGKASAEPITLPTFVEAMVERGWLGDKTGQGFYKKQPGKEGDLRLALDWRTLEYHPAQRAKIPSLEMAKNAESLPLRLRTLLAGDPQKDRAAAFYWPLLAHLFRYASGCIPEVAADPASIDRAMRDGFNWELGPFELWDALGVADTVARMRAAGEAAPAHAEKLLAAGFTSWYRTDEGAAGSGGKYVFDPVAGNYRPLVQPEGVATVADFRRVRGILRGNPGASLIDMGDGVAAVELHSKKNAIGEDITSFLTRTLHPSSDAVRDFSAFVLTGDGANFSVGANLFQVLLYIQEADWDEVDLAVRAFQQMTAAVKFCPRPVAVAPYGLCLGGGAEIALHAACRQPYAELYLGLVETSVGLVPAGGGCKEMVLRAADAAAAILPSGGRDAAARLAGSVEYFDALKRSFEQIATSKVSTSAAEAKAMGYLSASDRVTLHRDRVANEAKLTVTALAAAGYTPPVAREVAAAGQSALATLKLGVHLMRQAEYASEHDQKVANHVANILCGGAASPGTPLTEQNLLDLEREAFLSLCGERKTQERIAFTLKTGKPLRN